MKNETEGYGRKFKVIREIIIIVIILIISTFISVPSYLSEVKEYKSIKVDDWKTSSPEMLKMNSSLLKSADKYIAGTNAASFLVIRGGKLIYESYYKGNDLNSFCNVYSVTKSFMSALIGIAIEKGYIKSVEQKLPELIPEYFKQNTYADKREIKLKHLLTMTPGFCEDLDSLTRSKDWVAYTLQLPIKNKPGERFEYANSASHLLSVILTKATGMSTKAFADKFLLEPLNLKEKEWAKDPQNYFTGYANLFIRPRDMAKLGQLYLKDGKWNGKQLINANWVKESTTKHVDTSDDLKEREKSGYGYQWWTSIESGYKVFSAVGYGGQYICVIKDLDLVVVMNNCEDISTVLGKYIIPACLNKN